MCVSVNCGLIVGVLIKSVSVSCISLTDHLSTASVCVIVKIDLPSISPIVSELSSVCKSINGISWGHTVYTAWDLPLLLRSIFAFQKKPYSMCGCVSTLAQHNMFQQLNVIEMKAQILAGVPQYIYIHIFSSAPAMCGLLNHLVSCPHEPVPWLLEIFRGD